MPSGEATVRLRLAQKKFSQGVKRASANLKGLRGRMEGVRAAAGKIGAAMKRAGTRIAAVGAVAATAAAAGITAMTKAGIDSVSAIGRVSKQTGETVKSLSALRFAAKQTGVDFDDLTGAAEELNIRLGEAVLDNSGPAGAALQKIGLDAKDLLDLPFQERLGRIADALNRVQNNAQRGFLADEIFGGDAFKILPLLREGAAGIGAMADEAERLGVTFDSVDAAKVTAAGRAVRKIGAAFDGIKNALAIELAPIIGAVANRLREMSSTGDGLRSKVGGAVEFVLGVVGKLADAWHFVKLGVQGFKAGAMQALAVVAKAVNAVVSRMLSAVQQVLSATRTVADVLPGIGAGDIDSAIAGIETTRRRGDISAEALQQQATREGARFNEMADAERPSEQFAKWLAQVRKDANQQARQQAAKDRRERIKTSTAPITTAQAGPGFAQFIGQAAQGIADRAGEFVERLREQMEQSRQRRDFSTDIDAPAPDRQASIVGAGELFRRTLLAAQGGADPEQQTAKNTKDTAKHAKATASGVGKVVERLTAIEERLAQAGTYRA